MVLMHTPEKSETFYAANFNLEGVDRKNHSFDDIKGEKGTLVLFICNHCPYVISIIDRLVEDCKTLQENGIGVVAIMPNDTEAYPADSLENMKVFSDERGFTFPYLIDKTQEISRAYDAVCTPDIYGFDADGALQYRGRIDSAGMDEPTADIKRELRDAMLEIAKIDIVSTEQVPSMGCSIKWKE